MPKNGDTLDEFTKTAQPNSLPSPPNSNSSPPNSSYQLKSISSESKLKDRIISIHVR